MSFKTHIISFPGIGIGEFEISQRAFSILGRDVAWYGIIVTSAILLGMIYAFWRGVKNGITLDDMIDIAIFSIPAAMFGARIYYVLFNLSSFPTFYSVIAVWEGGLAVYGGIILGLVTAYIVCRIKKIPILKVFDSVAPAIMLGQIIGRWGNFVNAEAHGGPTSLPWGMSIRRLGDSYAEIVHPTFLYEMLWNLLGFILINVLYKKKKFDGQIFLMYATWYGFGRMFIEGLRTDSLYIGQTDLRVSQIFAFLCFVAGAVLLTVLGVRAKKKSADEESYESQYNLSSLSNAVGGGNEESDEEQKQATVNSMEE